jgi:pimeloyl-ACP methyl ester carboxylesterase
MVERMTPFYEQIAIFGIRQNLNGILTVPRHGGHANKPALVILNSGVVHRIGHHRMYVTMARRLAAAGHAVLRFDLSGIGDSASSGSLEPSAAAIADVASALDWLSETRGIKTAVLLGLCSGADLALKYGYTDDRIAGLVLLDPTIPPTWRFYMHYISDRVTNMRSWRTFLRGRGRIWGDLISRMVAAAGVPLIEAQRRLVDPQSRTNLEALFKHSLERNLRLLVVFTKGFAEYEEQLLHAFPSLTFGKMLTLEYFNDCDHVFTPAKHRERLNQLVLTFLRDTFQASSVDGRLVIETGLNPRQSAPAGSGH